MDYTPEIEEINITDEPRPASLVRRGSTQRADGEINRNTPSEGTDSTVDAMMRAIAAVIEAPRPSKFTMTLPKFSGDPELAFDFVQEYETVADVNGWDDKMKIKFFSAALEGGAKTWFNGVNQVGFTWETL